MEMHHLQKLVAWDSISAHRHDCVGFHVGEVFAAVCQHQELNDLEFLQIYLHQKEVNIPEQVKSFTRKAWMSHSSSHSMEHPLVMRIHSDDMKHAQVWNMLQ